MLRLGYELNIEQTQKLTMTPELIQAIQILQYNGQELQEFVDKELLENPVIELAEENDDRKIDIDELGESILRSEEELDTYKKWDYNPPSREEEYSFQNYVAVKKTLLDHLIMQLNLSDLEGYYKQIGRCIVEAVDENGYLTMSTAEIAEAAEVSEEDVEDVLKVIQTFDPPGVAARNLAECLKIQLRRNKLLDEDIIDLMDDILADLADNKIMKIASDLGITPGEAQDLADLIRTLEPRPGQIYDTGESIKYIIPDIFVEKINGEYIVSTNETSVPKLTISSYYNKLAPVVRTDERLSEYLNKRFSSAIWLIKSIDQRKNTIFKVASAIVERQKEFLDRGEKYLKPMTLKDIADDTGVHESTVSRTINGKYIQSCRGVLELKYFFSGGLINDDGNSISFNGVKAIMKDIIEGEDQENPYSDLKIAELLKDRGIEISRRTVAKYREEMGIRSSNKRRRF